jgi:hypothetical protein
MESQEDILSSGRMNGIGPKVLKQAAAKLGIVFERHAHPDIGGLRTKRHSKEKAVVRVRMSPGE